MLVFLVLLLVLPQDLVSGIDEELPFQAQVTGITGRAQKYNLSCESRSAVDLAIYWDVRVSETQFLKSLTRSDNPEEGFVGSPNGYWGYTPPLPYGVHAGPVARSLRKFGLRATAHKGLSWDQLRAEIAAGRPVIVWVIGHMWPGKPLQYESDSGTTTVARFEHSMLLVGYTPEKVTVIDPSHGKSHTYTLKEFKRSWKVLGNMAVFVTGLLGEDENLHVSEDAVVEESAQASQVYSPLSAELTSVQVTRQELISALEATPLIIVPITYKVKEGDTLPGLAEQFRLNLKQLAGKNSIAEPYTLFTNQVLLLGE